MKLSQTEAVIEREKRTLANRKTPLFLLAALVSRAEDSIRFMPRSRCKKQAVFLLDSGTFV
jgi:hypothetical protein